MKTYQATITCNNSAYIETVLVIAEDKNQANMILCLYANRKVEYKRPLKEIKIHMESPHVIPNVGFGQEKPKQNSEALKENDIRDYIIDEVSTSVGNDYFFARKKRLVFEDWMPEIEKAFIKYSRECVKARIEEVLPSENDIKNANDNSYELFIAGVNWTINHINNKLK